MSDLNPRGGEDASQSNKPNSEPETLSPTETEIGPATALEINGHRKATIEAKNAASEAKNAASEAKDAQKETLDAVKKGERIALIIAAIVALGTIGQWITTSCNDASTSAQTSKLICAAEKFRLAAEGIQGGVGNAVDKLNLQAGELQKSVRQASRLADDTEKSNRNALNADRPWIGGTIHIENFEVGKIPVVTIVFMNSGKRPAKVTLSEAHDGWYKSFPSDPPYDFDTTPSVAVVVPNTALISRFNLSKQGLSEAEMKAAITGKPTYFIYANVEYTDLRTGERHHSHFCWRYIGNSKALAPGFYGCDGYDDAN